MADTNIRKHVGELPPWRCPAGQYDDESRELNESKALTNCDNCNELRREERILAGRNRWIESTFKKHMVAVVLMGHGKDEKEAGKGGTSRVTSAPPEQP